MNIAIITTSLNSGGAERIAGLLSKELAKQFNVYLFLLSTDNMVYDYGGTIINIGMCGPFYDYPIKLYKQKYKIDVAISFLEIMNFANIRTRGTERVIVSERCVQSLINPPLEAQSQKIKRYYPWADEIVSCSFGVEYDLRKNYGITENITSIYNFIDKENIISCACDNLPETVKSFLNGRPFFLNVGRLHEQKNQKRLINQFSIFHKNNSEVKLIILGSGKLENELNKVIEAKELSNYVKIIPYSTNPFVYMNNAKAIIVSSHYEGLPNVVIEAMTLGCPLIATDCLAGPRELLDDILDYELPISQVKIGARGILIPDVESEDTLETHYMADAMELLYSDPSLKIKFTNSQKEYMNRYTNEVILEQWLRVIEGKLRKKCDVVSEEFNMLHQKKSTYIYGAGYVGLSYFFRLKDKFDISGFVVTHKNKNKNESFGIPIYEICEFKYDNDEVQFIMGVGDESQDEVLRTLYHYGYYNVVYPSIDPFGYDYYLNKCFDLKKELTNWYRIKTELDIDIDNPSTFNEKIQWLKVYDNLPIKKILTDKTSVREYVKKKIGGQYLIPIIGVWNSYEEIPFELLPKQFILKCSVGSDYTIMVYDKDTINHKNVRQKFNEWQNLKMEFVDGFEMHYEGLESKIIVESMLLSEKREDWRDIKLLVFNGKVKLIQVDIEINSVHKRNLYTIDWAYLPFSLSYPTAPEITIVKPACLDELIRLAEKLGEQFIYAGIDFIIHSSKIYFNDFTFTYGSGIVKFEPLEFGKEMGCWMQIGGK